MLRRPRGTNFQQQPEVPSEGGLRRSRSRHDVESDYTAHSWWQEEKPEHEKKSRAPVGITSV